MSCWNVIITAVDRNPAAAEALRKRLCSIWSGASEATFTCAEASQVTVESLQAVDLVIVTATGLTERPQAASLLAAVEQAGVGLLSVVDPAANVYSDIDFAGGLMLEPDVSDISLLAAAQGLMHRQGDVRRLNQELKLAQRCHGGLEGEIARMHEELQLAAMVQREMLPRTMPSVLGVSFAAMWRPANYVSGDIYDITQLDDEHIGVLITDAVGHGVPAALMTMIISRSVITTERRGDRLSILSPSQVLSRLNAELLLRQGRTTRFATGIYAVVNCRTRRCCLAGAGHPPPLLLKPDGSHQALETSGGLLGVFGDETYDQIEFDLAAGDQMLLYSDGFEQAFPSDDADVYEQRLPTTHYRKEFENLAKLNDPAQVVNHIRERLDAQRGSLHQIDDLTLICMSVGAAQQSSLKSKVDRVLSGS